MCASIGGIINTATQGLFAQQAALQIVSQNISNVNTEGYSRQRVIFEASRFGAGVSVQSIDRLRNDFFDVQMRQALTRQGYLDTVVENLRRVESTLDETEDSGVGQRLRELFASFHDLAANPDGVAERETVRTKAELLASILSANDGSLGDVRKNADREIEGIVAQINSVAEQIAALNGDIAGLTGSAGMAGVNELIDQRQLLVDKLSALARVQVLEDESGAMTVLIGAGAVLVQGNDYAQLETAVNAERLFGIELVAGGAFRQDITNQFTEGSLGAIFTVRDQTIPELRDQIDLFVATLIDEINDLHRQGIDLNGVAGGNFFDGLTATAAASSSNSGDATVTAASIVDETLLTIDDYEIQFNNLGQYQVVDVTQGTTVVAWTGYVSGTAITFDGISVTITDGPSGAPQNGDVFEVNTYAGAASNIEVAAAILNDTNAIAAAQSAAPGDNLNALELASLETAAVAPGGATLSDYYESILTALGIEVRQAVSNQGRQDLLVEQTRNFVLSASGVSIDEESVNLILFQRAFEGSARVLSVIDDLYGVIINMVG